MVKIHKMVCIDQDIDRQLKERGINISGECNRHLRTLINPDMEKKKDQLFEEAYKLNEEGKQIEQELQRQEQERIDAINKADQMELEEKAARKARIEAERNSPERKAKRQEMLRYAEAEAKRKGVELTEQERARFL